MLLLLDKLSKRWISILLIFTIFICKIKKRNIFSTKRTNLPRLSGGFFVNNVIVQIFTTILTLTFYSFRHLLVQTFQGLMLYFTRLFLNNHCPIFVKFTYSNLNMYSRTDNITRILFVFKIEVMVTDIPSSQLHFKIPGKMGQTFEGLVSNFWIKQILLWKQFVWM